jgi:NAD(P)-dependent dehydrogenase (short-subunit alcohol dehydrogenase family)
VNVAGKVAVVTGGGGGLGGALARALVAAGARVLVTDLNETAAAEVVARIETSTPQAAVSVGADASKTVDIRELVALAENTFGPVDLYFANAGVIGAAGLGATDADWDIALEVNLRSHVRAAQLLVPKWLQRGGGYFVSTASAAGLLTQIGSATYATTKHAAVGFSEWLSVTYGDRGVRVSCLCPMGVETKLLHADGLGDTGTRAVLSAGKVLQPDQVADVVLDAITREQFLILPHPEVLRMYRHKGADYDRWLRGMRRFQGSLEADIS